MVILHYFLGFPPYRSGGLTKYAFDLMKSQVDDGHEVIALWPGKIENYYLQPKIKERKKVEGIRNFELVNPLPVSLDEGIVEFEAYTRKCDIGIYLSFLHEKNPNVIHIHTLMGLHKEFVMAANQLNVRTVMTSHDYFGLCPKVTLYRFGSCCDEDNGCRNCVECNLTALTLKKIQIMQSSFYRLIKNMYFVRKLRNAHRNEFFREKIIPKLSKEQIERLAEKYKDLRSFYVEIYEMIDLIHFNSTLTEKIYRRYIKPRNSKVVSITHQGIEIHKKCKVETSKKVILCLAPAKPYKGWDVLKEACDQLWLENENFELRIYSPVNDVAPYMVIKEEGFSQNELEKVMREADVLVAPSVWYETFGFTVLEALSYGVPVIVSDHVGAKDIIGSNGIVIKSGDVEELKNAIKSIDINVEIDIKSWRQFLDENYEMYGALL